MSVVAMERGLPFLLLVRVRFGGGFSPYPARGLREETLPSNIIAVLALKLWRLFVSAGSPCRAAPYGVGIEQQQIRVRACFDLTAVTNAVNCGRLACQSMDCLFHGHDLFIPHPVAQ